jgi:hypothetical protein
MTTQDKTYQRQQNLLTFFERHRDEWFTAADIHKRLRSYNSETTAREDMVRLVEEGFLERDRNDFWFILDGDGEPARLVSIDLPEAEARQILEAFETEAPHSRVTAALREALST